MHLLLSHISYLLGEHRVVPVVGLGTFTRTEVCAEIEPGGIKSPSFSVGFTTEVDPRASHLVEESISRSTGLQTGEIAAMVDDEVSALHRALYEGREVEIEGVGTLVNNKGVPEFIPSGTPCWSTCAWYSGVDSAPLVQEEEPVRTLPEPAVREAFMRSLSRTASSAAAIAVFILIAFVTSQLPGRRTSQEPTFATFGVESTAVAPSEALIPRPGAVSPALVLVLNTPSDGIIEPTPARVSPLDSDAPYVLVVASLANEKEVARYMESHPGEGLDLLRSQGRYRVFAATGSTIRELQDIAQESGLYSRYPNAWICRR